MIRIAFVALGVLAGCQPGIMRPEPIEVRVPVPVQCVGETPRRPDGLMTDAELGRLPDNHQLALALDVQRRQWRGHAEVLEATLEGCRR